MLGTSGDGGADGIELGGAGGFSEEDKVRIEEGDRNSAGNRWPRQETLALLQIRSDMDAAFRDSSFKGPLWEEVSRKLSELGYHRSAKKCKEKFENVYKYHRRTKEGRISKPDGKTYRFFDQLEALENQAPPVPQLPPPPRPQTHPAMAATPLTVAMPAATTIPPIFSHLTVPSTTGPVSGPQSTTIISTISPQPPPPPPETTIAATISADPISFSFHAGIAPSHLKMPVNVGSMSTSSSSSTSSDEEPERRRKRKRKWTDFFQRLMNEVVEKQEEMQKRFIESLERRERDRVAREEAWRAQELVRMNREHDLLVHERSMAAAKDAAVIAFLQKVSEQQVPSAPPPQMQNNSQPPPPKSTPLPHSQPELEIPQPPPPPLQPQPPGPLVQVQPPPKSPKTDNKGAENIMSSITSSSRWPKEEVQALIRLRTNMDLKYQENGPKGPLWEEMSSEMRKIGYDRNAKRCKEKWENINKYFKKVKESNKKRPEDSKTCPYFHDLDVLYREKAKNETTNNLGSGFGVKMENPMAPIMVQPEQQWPLPQQQPESAVEDDESDQNHEGDDEGDDEGDEEEEEEEEVGGFEIVANKPSSVGTVE
ncbi:hypothetical protein Acr_00g0052450 [Actinidia rufa]|uniref:Myb-like domain-containing protein n=1 Tax=Actinidia rufa TaxID=165716 RepID=A0A7J0DN09_9ERIC|nr:hypothetical protein Acr_00g0052450 [Actinidia rufa]